MSLFTNQSVNLNSLRTKAFNYRWATHDSDVIPLTAADPDFPIAVEISEAITKYCTEGYFSYGPAQGLPDFKEAIANWYERKKNVPAKAENILPVNSAAHGLFICAKLLLKEGENAIIPDPVDFLFRKSIEDAKAIVKTCSISEEDASFDLEKLETLIDDNTKAIFICNPNNPLGKVIPRSHLIAVLALAKKHDLWVVCDEIWSDICFDTPFQSIAAQGMPPYEKILLVSGLSKNFALAGLRIGFVIAPNQDIFNQLLDVSGHKSTAFGLSVLSQVAGTTALTKCDYWLTEFQNHLAKMRKLTLEFTEQMPFLEKPSPDATYLAFPGIHDYRKSAAELTADILKHARVALVPGGINWFEAKSEGHLRICYSTSEQILQQAFERIDKNKHLF